MNLDPKYARAPQLAQVPVQRPDDHSAAWRAYEAAKAALPRDLTPEQYALECRRLAREAGV